MKVNHVKTAVLGSLLVLAGLAVILLPAYAGDLEPIAQLEPKGHSVHKTVTIARPEPKLQGVYKVELNRDDLIKKAELEEDCGAATAVGYSESFSFDEAFKNALHALPEDTTPVYPDKMGTVRVVEIYATFGGITGGSYLCVRVQRDADPSCLNSKKKQRAEPGGEEEIRKQHGELKKLPSREIEIREGTITGPKPIEEK